MSEPQEEDRFGVAARLLHVLREFRLNGVCCSATRLHQLVSVSLKLKRRSSPASTTMKMAAVRTLATVSFSRIRPGCRPARVSYVVAMAVERVQSRSFGDSAHSLARTSTLLWACRQHSATHLQVSQDVRARSEHSSTRRGELVRASSQPPFS